MHRHEGRAQAVNCVGSHHPLDRIVADDRDSLAGPNAQPGEPRTRLVDQFADLAIAQPVPLPCTPGPQERSAGVSPATVLQQLDEVAGAWTGRTFHSWLRSQNCD